MVSLLLPPLPQIFLTQKQKQKQRQHHHFHFNFHFLHTYSNRLPFRICSVYSIDTRLNSNPNKPDSIAILNESIRRHHSARESAAPVMDSKEAEQYIRLVKEQQQRGLQKLKGDREAKEGGVFNYKVDPYSLRSGDYVVHKKVGVGKFVAIRLDFPQGCTEGVEYVYIQYADGMAKLPVKQASRLLYRYNL